MPMNTAVVVIGHLTNPFDLKGSFSVHFNAEDFAANGTLSKASGRGFNLTVDAGCAKASSVHFLLVRLSDGLRIEGYAECLPGRRNHVVLSGKFAAPGATEPRGQFDSVLHWDGEQGVLTATWTVPRN